MLDIFLKNTYSGDSFDCGDYPAYNMKFTARDKDQDENTYNCAIKFTGAWWYNHCHCANLNGLYLAGKTDLYAQGMTWDTFRGQYYSLKTTQIKFRADY